MARCLDVADAGSTGAVRSKEHRRLLAEVLLLAVPSLVLWVLVYPGFFQADHQGSIARLAQGDPSQWHSMLWQLVAYPFLYLSPSFGIYGAVQIAGFVAAMAFSIERFRKAGILSDRGTLVLAAAMGLCPSYVCYNQLYSSDIVFAYLLVPLLALLVDVVRTRGRALSSRRFCVGLAALVAVECLLRKNALLIIVLCWLFLVFVISKEHRRRLALAFLGAIACFLAASWAFTDVMGAEESPSQEMLSVPAQQIARVYSEGLSVPEEADEYLTSIRSAEEWASLYEPSTADPEKENLELTPELVHSWLQVAAAHPLTCLRAYGDLESAYWKLSSSPSDGQYEDYATTGISIDFGDYDSFTTRLSEGLREGYVSQFGNGYEGLRGSLSQIINRLYSGSVPVVSDAFRLLFFNRALPFYVILGCLAVSIIRRFFGRCLVIVSPALSVLVSLLLFSPVPLMRYAMEMYYLLPFMVVWCRQESLAARGLRPEIDKPLESATQPDAVVAS